VGGLATLGRVSVTRHGFWLGILVAALSTSAFAQTLPSTTGPSNTPTTPNPTRPQVPEEVVRGDTVAGRARPDYDPLGQRLGGFLLFPDLQVQEAYNSNIFYTPTNRTRDYVTTINPNLDLRSNWDQHALNLHADANIVRYAHTSSENYEDYSLGGDGRVDVLHDLRGYGGAAYRVRHEARYSPDNIFGAATPTEYSDTAANLAGEKEFNRLSFRLDGNYDKYEYKDVRANSGAVIAQHLRDHDEKQVALRTQYEFAPLRQIYLLTAYNDRSYDNNSDIFGFNRNSTGYTVAVGARYDVTGVIFADGFIGYREQDYKDSRLATASGMSGGAALTWNVTRLTTVTGSVVRDVQETVISGASSYFGTRTALGVDHELLRNLILNGNVSYERDDFEGIDRADDLYSAGAGARYLINNNFWLSGGYQYLQRDSNGTSASTGFKDNVVFGRISAHL
jgi:hypothetical protein